MTKNTRLKYKAKQMFIALGHEPTRFKTFCSSDLTNVIIDGKSKNYPYLFEAHCKNCGERIQITPLDPPYHPIKRNGFKPCKNKGKYLFEEIKKLSKKYPITIILPKEK